MKMILKYPKSIWQREMFLFYFNCIFSSEIGLVDHYIRFAKSYIKIKKK